jgi:hypothetical protein
VPPDVDERLLDRIIGEMSVTQDAVGHSKQPGVVGEHQGLESPLVATLRPPHEVLAHGLSVCLRRTIWTVGRAEPLPTL